MNNIIISWKHSFYGKKWFKTNDFLLFLPYSRLNLHHLILIFCFLNFCSIYFCFLPSLCVDEIIKKKKSNKTDLKNSLTTMANKFLILMEKTSKETNLFTFHKSFNGFLDMKNREFVRTKKKKSKSKWRTFIFINLLDKFP